VKVAVLMRSVWIVTALSVGALTAACKSVSTTPAVTTPLPPPPPVIPLDKKVAWIYRLEQQRALRDAPPETPAAGVDLTTASLTGLTLYAATSPDLILLSVDPEPMVRRRALLALGRVGLREALPVLAGSLKDPDTDVRATAAFALGLVGDREATPALVTALADPSPVVRGRVAEGLGLIADATAAASVAQTFAGCKTDLAAIEPDDEQPKSPEVEACKLALFALVRLRNYEALARVALDEQGQPVSRWWPIAYALQRIGDRRAAGALLALASGPGVYTPSFAFRGLATAKDTRAVAPALAVASRRDADVRLRVAAVRMLGQIGGADAVAPLMKLTGDAATPKNLAIEIVDALGSLGDRRAFDLVLDRLTDPWPSMRAAAFNAAAKIDPDGFLLVVSSLDRDVDWSVRAALATIFGDLPNGLGRPALIDLLGDSDVRVQGPAMSALAKIGVPDLGKRLFDLLDAPDAALRATSATLMGEARPEGGAARLVMAYSRGDGDATYVARLAALDAVAKYGGNEARELAKRALADREWPVRVRAAELLHALGDAEAQPQRPAPLRFPDEIFESERVLRPKYSPHVFIETRQGTIEFELNVVDAPFTSMSFVELARSGFYNGIRVHRLVPNFVIQTGDPRGDGEGGPGYTLRDEFNMLPYVRGTVGMALAGKDTGGSQFFIAVSPQPHLDGKYTVFGRVVNGFDLLDRISQWDVIERVRVWDGEKMGQ
jgi:cyclophilin family peptidyl-prolyl cis-trans isomerase/HEAT repeat protein